MRKSNFLIYGKRYDAGPKLDVFFTRPLIRGAVNKTGLRTTFFPTVYILFQDCRSVGTELKVFNLKVVYLYLVS